MLRGPLYRKSSRSGLAGPLEGIGPGERHTSVAEMVFHRLKDAIMRGDLEPGQRLVEQKLSDKLRVSRAPVREALQRLEEYGFVARLPARGIVVKTIPDREREVVLGIRAALESYAAVRVCERAEDELIAALEETIGASARALRDGDAEAAADLDTRFHQMIYEAAGSDMLSRLIGIFVDYTSRCERLLPASRVGAKVSLEHHKAMLEAMRRGDKEEVERIVRANVLQREQFDPRDRPVPTADPIVSSTAESGPAGSCT